MSKKMQEKLAPPILPQSGHIGQAEDQYDAVFGDITEDGPNYRNVRVTCIFHYKLINSAVIRSGGWERLFS